MSKVSNSSVLPRVFDAFTQRNAHCKDHIPVANVRIPVPLDTNTRMAPESREDLAAITFGLLVLLLEKLLIDALQSDCIRRGADAHVHLSCWWCGDSLSHCCGERDVRLAGRMSKPIAR